MGPCHQEDFADRLRSVARHAAHLPLHPRHLQVSRLSLKKIVYLRAIFSVIDHQEAALSAQHSSHAPVRLVHYAGFHGAAQGQPVRRRARRDDPAGGE